MAGAKPKKKTAAKKSAPKAPGRGKYDRARSPDERQREQLGRLLDAAGHVFAEVGWADATVEGIVSRAGMSRRTFYEHFDDLQDCLLIFHQKATRRAFRAVEMAVQAAPPTGEKLRMGVMGFLGGSAAITNDARVIFRVVRSAGPEFEPLHDDVIARFAKLFHEGLSEAYAVGRTELPPDELRIFAVVSAMEAVAMRYVARGDEAKALEAAPALIDMVERTFGAKRP